MIVVASANAHPAPTPASARSSTAPAGGVADYRVSIVQQWLTGFDEHAWATAASSIGRTVRLYSSAAAMANPSSSLLAPVLRRRRWSTSQRSNRTCCGSEGLLLGLRASRHAP